MNRIEIKERAKKIVKENFKEIWIGFLIIIGISVGLNLILNLLLDEKSVIYGVFELVISFFELTLSVGLYSYLLKLIREKTPDNSEIFKYVGKVLPIICIGFLTSVFILLGFVLLIVPGIILAIAYTMVFLIYVDNDELQPLEYLTKSREMMNGYKLDYFVFNLSFIGWIILSCLTLGILFIYTIPYMSIAQLIYYEDLKNIKENEFV